jgi:hypothetical protein
VVRGVGANPEDGAVPGTDLVYQCRW